MNRTTKKMLPGIFAASIFLVVAGAAWYFWPEIFGKYGKVAWKSDPGRAELGQLGDSFGAFNAAIGVCTLVGLGLTIIFQARALDEREEERALERFDQVFARIMTTLERHVEIMSDMTTIATPRAPQGSLVRGKEVFQEWATQISNEIIGYTAVSRLIVETEPTTDETLRHLKATYKHLFERKHEDLAPYWRLLYHAFKTIDKAEIDPAEKRLYADIVRADFTPSQSLLLALNGIGEFGGDFWDLINRYHLLKHLPQKYKDIIGKAYNDDAYADRE